jgi:uncharacterized Ntn-hydrolase superfamily protein
MKRASMGRVLALLLSFAATTWAQLRPVHTFSIVARDSQTGELGVAVQSHWFAVGPTVPWAEAGVGAVATQSFVDPSYGKLGLDLMRAGRSAPEALRGLLNADKSCEVRQVAMIDINGKVASFTGAKNISPAGGTIAGGKSTQFDCGGAGGTLIEGRDFSTQANLMSNDKIWPAMAKVFQETKGDLAERLLTALEAAQTAGGDTRGRQSAALIVVSAKSTGQPWHDKSFDLRVDDSPEPLKELRKLVLLQRAYNHMNAGDEAVEHHDNETALREYAMAEETASKAENVEPSRLAEMRFWHAVALVNMKRVDESLLIFKGVFAGTNGANWRELTTRLPKSGLLPNDAALIKKIQSQ